MLYEAKCFVKTLKITLERLTINITAQSSAYKYWVTYLTIGIFAMKILTSNGESMLRRSTSASGANFCDVVLEMWTWFFLFDRNGSIGFIWIAIKDHGAMW